VNHKNKVKEREERKLRLERKHKSGYLIVKMFIKLE